MLGHFGRFRQVIAVPVRLEYLVDAQQVMRQEQTRVERLFAGGTDHGPEGQQLRQRQPRQIEESPNGDQLVEEIGRNVAGKFREVRAAAIFFIAILSATTFHSGAAIITEGFESGVMAIVIRVSASGAWMTSGESDQCFICFVNRPAHLAPEPDEALHPVVFFRRNRGTVEMYQSDLIQVTAILSG